MLRGGFIMHVFIVDDEELSCRGLAYMVNCIFSQTPQEIHCFTSPVEALSKMELFAPDVILRDITMDEMNGLEFITKIDKKFTPKIVIISGNNDYNFVRESFKLSVVDYLLKPIEFGELESIMLKICNPEDTFKEQENANDYQDEYSWGFVAVFKKKGGDELTNKIINIPKICGLKEYVSVLTYDEEYSYSVYIFSMQSKEYYSSCKNSLIDIFKELANEKEELFKGAYSSCVRADEISKAIAQAKSILNSRIYDNVSVCYGPEDNIEKEEVSDEDFIKDLEALTPFLNADDETCYKQIVSMWFSREELLQLNYENIRTRYTMFESKLIREINFDKVNLQIKKFEEFDTVDEIILHIECMISAVLEFLKKNKFEVNIMSEAFKYIGENYNKDINLGFMSNKFNLSYSYFSRIFKMYAGVSFTQYLLKIRMEKAKELLMQSPNLKIKEVALMVGYDYDNVQNFTRAFKKYFGRSPQHYKG